jgi:hypothetical protein
MKIISVFSGRKNNIEVQRLYLQKALDLKIIDEVHYWNFTRNVDDDTYMKSISNLRRTATEYVLIKPELIDNSFELYIDIKTNENNDNNIFIKIEDTTKEEYDTQIIQNNFNPFVQFLTNKEIRAKKRADRKAAKKTAIKTPATAAKKEYDNEVISFKYKKTEEKNKYQINIKDNILNVLLNDVPFITKKIKDDFIIKNIYFKTDQGTTGEISYEPQENKGFYLMELFNRKSWNEYYNYYNNKKFENDIIIKCDDDVVFIDLYKLPQFIEFVKNNDYDLVFANIINNGVAAYYQQNKYNLIPKSLMELEYPPNGLNGSLWKSGEKAELLHKYFIENSGDFLNNDFSFDVININTRFSINFFGYKGNKWRKIAKCGINDEYNLTVKYVKNNRFNNVLYSNMIVAHLSFYKQIETKMNTIDILEGYKDLYNIYKK